MYEVSFVLGVVQVEPALAVVPAGIVDLLQTVSVVSLQCVSLSLFSHLHDPHHYGSQAVGTACTGVKEVVLADTDLNVAVFVSAGLRVAGLAGYWASVVLVGNSLWAVVPGPVVPVLV